MDSALTSTASDRTAADRVLDLAEHGLDRSFRLAGLILGDVAEAEDATQEALLHAWRSADSLRDLGGFGAWFDRILVNVCRDRLRRRGRVRSIDIAGAHSVAVARDPFRSVVERDELLRAMSTLADEERLVILLHYWSDLTLEAVAERVGWPVGTVKSRLHRALRTMRSELDDGRAGGTAR
jgi:RNA polymerase sigma-70 factor (ECF subfamily)